MAATNVSEVTGEILKRTPLYDLHRELKGRIVPFAGWEMPVQYSSIVKEHHAVREQAGLFDVSHMGELRLRGPEAEDVVNGLITNDLHSVEVGKALYTMACNEQGGILDDLIVYRVGEHDVLVVPNAGNRDKLSPHFRKAAEGRCEFSDDSDDTALLALQGPNAEKVMRAAGGEQLADLERFGVAQGTVAGQSVIAARTGYTGEDGFELFCPADGASGLFKALLEAGTEHGLVPVGLGARDTLRLEAALRLYGNDMDESVDPYEAGLGWTVKLDAGEFLGKAALAEKKAAGPSRRLVGLEMTARGIARHGYPILNEAEERVGEVCSGGPAPTLGKNIGLGFVPRALAKKGTSLKVEIRGKHVDAKVVATPFYKRST